VIPVQIANRWDIVQRTWEGSVSQFTGGVLTMKSSVMSRKRAHVHRSPITCQGRIGPLSRLDLIAGSAWCSAASAIND